MSRFDHGIIKPALVEQKKLAELPAASLRDVREFTQPVPSQDREAPVNIRWEGKHAPKDLKNKDVLARSNHDGVDIILYKDKDGQVWSYWEVTNFKGAYDKFSRGDDNAEVQFNYTAGPLQSDIGCSREKYKHSNSPNQLDSYDPSQKYTLTPIER